MWVEALQFVTIRYNWFLAELGRVSVDNLGKKIKLSELEDYIKLNSWLWKDKSIIYKTNKWQAVSVVLESEVQLWSNTEWNLLKIIY